MPGRVIVVHDDPEFIQSVVTALAAAGHEARAFLDSLSAIDALEAAQRIEVLVTRVTFPAGQPHGVALALMARRKRPGVRILFAAHPENREHTEGLGEFLATPVTGTDVVRTVERMLAESG